MSAADRKLVHRCVYCGCVKGAGHTSVPHLATLDRGAYDQWYPTWEKLTANDLFEKLAADILNAELGPRDFSTDTMTVKNHFHGRSELTVEEITPRRYPDLAPWEGAPTLAFASTPAERCRIGAHDYRPWFMGQHKCMWCDHTIVTDVDKHERLKFKEEHYWKQARESRYETKAVPPARKPWWMRILRLFGEIVP
jgi:hypothetical protein